MEHLLSTFETWLNDRIDARTNLKTTTPLTYRTEDRLEQLENDAVSHEERLDQLDAWQEYFTRDTDVKEQIKDVVDEALRSIASQGRIKIYIDPEK